MSVCFLCMENEQRKQETIKLEFLNKIYFLDRYKVKRLTHFHGPNNFYRPL